MRHYSRRILFAAAAVALLTLAAPRLAARSELLSLDDAVQQALAHNRSIEQANLGVAGMDAAIAGAKTKRLPQFKFSSTTGILLTRPTMTFEKGAFGEYPGIGPIPGDTTKISSPRKPTAIVTSEVLVPLTQQYRIGLGIQPLELDKRAAKQNVRLSRQAVVKQVRQLYYSILLSHSSLESVDRKLALLRELSQQTTQYVKVVSTAITLLLVPVVYAIFVLDLKLVKWGTQELLQKPQVEPPAREDAVVFGWEHETANG